MAWARLVLWLRAVVVPMRAMRNVVETSVAMLGLLQKGDENRPCGVSGTWGAHGWTSNDMAVLSDIKACEVLLPRVFFSGLGQVLRRIKLQLCVEFPTGHRTAMRMKPSSLS